MLEGRNIVVLDLETARSANDCMRCGQPSESHAFEGNTLLCTTEAHQINTPLTPFDIYTRIGWDNKLLLGLSVGCYYDYLGGMYHWFDRATLEATVTSFVTRKPLLVSFNGIVFDFALMRALLRFDVPAEDAARMQALCDQFKAQCAESYDILAEIWRVSDAPRFSTGVHSLDAISVANGLGHKLSSGEQAPRLWQQGRYAEVLNYCQDDVKKTRLLFEQIFNTGTIKRGDGVPLHILGLPRIPSPRRKA